MSYICREQKQYIMVINKEVEKFNQAIRVDSNGLFIMIEHKIDKMSLTIINNFDNDVYTHESPIDPDGYFLEAALHFIDLARDIYINGLENIRLISNMYQLNYQLDGVANLKITNHNQYEN